MDLLGNNAVGNLGLAEFERSVAINRGVAVANHVHEDVGRPEHALDRGGGVGIGCRGIVAAEGLGLGADGGLRGGDVVRRPDGSRETDPECDS